VIDQNTKLSVFATRPAIYAPFFNWITEFVGTAFKVAGVQGIYLQAGTTIACNIQSHTLTKCCVACSKPQPVTGPSRGDFIECWSSTCRRAASLYAETILYWMA